MKKRRPRCIFPARTPLDISPVGEDDYIPNDALKYTPREEIFFPSDTTINYAVPGNATVGYANGDDAFHKTGTSPTVNLIEGSDIDFLSLENASTLNISGGTADFVSAYNTSTVNISGGMVTYVSANDNSTLNITGGTIEFILMEGSPVINLFGGNILYHLSSKDNATLNIYGTGWIQTLVKPDYLGDASLYELFGTLADGTVLSSKSLTIENNSTAQVNLIDTATLS